MENLGQFLLSTSNYVDFNWISVTALNSFELIPNDFMNLDRNSDEYGIKTRNHIYRRGKHRRHSQFKFDHTTPFRYEYQIISFASHGNRFCKRVNDET